MTSVFLIDDDKDFVNKFRELDLPGVDLHAYTSPKEALTDIKRLEPRIVVSDFFMPDLSGNDLRGIFMQFSVQFIMISGSPRQEIEEKYGFIDAKFFHKPLTDEFVEELIKLASIYKEPNAEENEFEKNQTELLEEKLFNYWKKIEDEQFRNRENINDWKIVAETTDKFLLETIETYNSMYKMWNIEWPERRKIEDGFKKKHHSATYRLLAKKLSIPIKNIEFDEPISLQEINQLKSPLKKITFKKLEIDENLKQVTLDGEDLDIPVLKGDLWKGCGELVPLARFYKIRDFMKFKKKMFVYKIFEPDFRRRSNQDLRITFEKPLKYKSSLNGAKSEAKDFILKYDTFTPYNEKTQIIPRIHNEHGNYIFEYFDEIEEVPSFLIHGLISTVKSCALPSKELSFEWNGEKLKTPIEYLRQIDLLKKDYQDRDDQFGGQEYFCNDFHKDQVLHVLFLQRLADGRCDQYGNDLDYGSKRFEPGATFTVQTYLDKYKKVDEDGKETWFQRVLKKIV